MSVKRFSAWLLILLVLLPLPAAYAGEAGSMWSVGFAAEAVLPDMDRLHNREYFIAGYRSGYPATAMLDPQYVRAVWLDDMSGEGGIILAAVDCVGLTSVDIGVIRGRLESFMKETGCRAVHICSTHTHAGIDTLGLWGPIAVSGRNEEFMETLYTAAETAVRNAYSARKQGRLFYGTAELPESFLRDSREPHVVDCTLTSLRFQPEDGSAGLRMLHFPAHAEALRSANSKISADYPGAMGRTIEEQTGDDFIYFTGAIGGLVMTEQLDANVYASMDKTGRQLAWAAIEIENEEELVPSLSAQTMSMDIPLDNTVFTVMQCLGVLRSDAVRGEGETGLAIRTQMSYLEIGGLPVILVPGELFPELALGYPEDFTGDNAQAENPPSFSEILGTDRFLVIGLADDEVGYIVPPSDFRVDDTLPYLERANINGRSHYEETNSPGPETANVVARTLEALVRTIRETKDEE